MKEGPSSILLASASLVQVTRRPAFQGTKKVIVNCAEALRASSLSRLHANHDAASGTS